MKKAERVQLLTSVRIRDFNVYHRHVKIHYFNSSCFQKDSNQNFIMLSCCYLPLASYPVISCEGPLTRLRHSLKLLLCIDWVVEYSSQFIILSWTNLDKERSLFCRPFPFFSPNKMKRMEKKKKRAWRLKHIAKDYIYPTIIYLHCLAKSNPLIMWRGFINSPLLILLRLFKSCEICYYWVP